LVIGTTRYLNDKCEFAKADINSGRFDGEKDVKCGTLNFYSQKEYYWNDCIHTVHINEEQFKQIYDDLKKYFEIKDK